MKHLLKRNYYFMYVIMCLTLIVCSCKIKYKTIVFKEKESVALSFFKGFTGVLQPLDMFKLGDNLFISDYRGDSLLWMFDLKKQEMKRRLLPKGLENSEFQSPIQIKHLKNFLFINNRWHYSAGKYKINPINNDIVLHGEKISVNVDIDMLYPVSDDLYVASGKFAEGRYTILNDRGEIINYFGDYPSYNKGEKDIPNFPKFMFHQTIFTQNPKYDHLLAAISPHTIDIFDIQDIYNPKKISHILLSMYDYSYDYGAGWASAKAINDTEDGAFFASSTKDYIYILYSPRIIGNKSSINKKNELWVFSWDGSPIKQYNFDKNIDTFCIDNDIVYCTTVNNPPKLAFFIL
jgi:hypothetical protein